MKYSLLATLMLLLAISACRKQNQTQTDKPDNDLIESRAVNVKITNNNPASLQLLSSGRYILTFSVEPLSTGYKCQVTTSQDIEIYDDSFAGYPTALPVNFVIGAATYFRQGTFILGSSLGQKGKFEGKGKSYLGFREKRTDGYHYGWISVEVAVANGKVEVYEYGIMNTADMSIKTAQTQ